MRTALKALCWKEIRENWIWSLVIFIVTTFLLFAKSNFFYFFIAAKLPGSNLRYDNPLDIYWQIIVELLLCVSLIWSISLPHLQCIREMHRDQMPVYRHKPVNGWVLFLGKALPGIFLYLSPMCLSFVFKVIWILFGGDIPAPINLYECIGGLTAIFACIPVYFAALYCATYIHQWHISRALPIITFICGAFIILYSRSMIFGLVILILSAIVSAIIAVSAYQRSQYLSTAYKIAKWLGYYLALSPVLYYLSTIIILPNLWFRLYDNDQNYMTSVQSADTMLSNNGNLYYSLTDSRGEHIYDDNGRICNKEINPDYS